MYRSIDLGKVKAKGWAKEFLKTQSDGLTGHLDEVINPFNTKYWDADDLSRTMGYDSFVGGMVDVPDGDKWVFYEQTGYLIDGMVRCAHLIDDEWLYEKVKPKLYKPIENADAEGYIGPHVLKDNLTWPHAVYFRSLMAEYEATGDDRILEALKKHFLRVPLRDVYDKDKSIRIMMVRNVADIETALWIYDKTRDRRFLNMAEDSYKRFNKLFSEDNGVAPHAKARPLTLKGMLDDAPARDNHGVTYCEICKLAAILYMHTGKELYKKAAINAFDKAYRDNIIIDGVICSSEYLNGNDDSRASHETCDVSDFTWAVGYLYMITGDNKYADWVEDAILNGGLGAVSDDFKSNQYFSCPNQVLCDDHSNHNKYFRGSFWMSYAPASSMACCTGNVNRFFPNFICRSWMRDNDTVAPFIYAPTEAEFNIDGKTVKITEDTKYPFENTVKFIISADEPLDFCLKLRVPCWALASNVTVNGDDGKDFYDGNTYNIKRTFKNEDVIEITFEDEIRFIENVGGISVKKGALLYALPIKERKVLEEKQRGVGNPEYPHFSLYPESNWNYGICMGAKDTAVFEDGAGNMPWKAEDNGMSITLDAFEVPGWEIQHLSKVRRYMNPRKRGKLIDCECDLTPLIPKKGTFEKGESKKIKLVPYCTTRLRIAIFPDCD